MANGLPSFDSAIVHGAKAVRPSGSCPCLCAFVLRQAGQAAPASWL